MVDCHRGTGKFKPDYQGFYTLSINRPVDPYCALWSSSG